SLEWIRSGARRLLLRELLPLHVGPDLLGHLRGPDRRGAHHGLEAVAAALEVDRKTTEPLFPFRHAPSSLRVMWPRVLGCAARRLPIRPRVLSRDHEGAQGKNTIPGGAPTGGKLPGGGIPPGGFRYRRAVSAGITSRANQASCSLNSFGPIPSPQGITISPSPDHFAPNTLTPPML